MFLNEEECKNKFHVIEKMTNMKKNAFLNATNTNFLPTDLREFYLQPVTKKLYKWVNGIDKKTNEKINYETFFCFNCCIVSECVC